ncbi:MAG: outer membrane protein transport protein [Betaproteobacteria bacterium]|nr:outer membrane protein transport protein [Betaproteobacteria bacterium]MDH5221735.1 outer membrane protein transport protein [Betaproteobacteria bacterium]
MRKLLLAAAATAVLAPGAAFATTGYFAHGYGIKAKSMGGVGIALPQDALAPATNPAGIAFVGNRIDLGAEWFTPDRGASITGSGAPGANGTYDGNDTKSFLIPEFGYNRVINPNWTFGVAVYGNGGMNTDYKTNPFAAFGGTGSAGVDLMQLFVAPTVAWKSGNHAIGVSLNLAYQRFKAEGIQGFAMFSASPGNVSNNGYDDSTGVGVRIGWTGQVSPTVTLGATYQSTTKMGEFDKYKGLFADQGDFDIPENYGLGIAWKATPALTLAADVLQINYSDVASVGNTADCLFMGACQLGGSNGPGFGWQDTTVFKIGLAYEMKPGTTLRAGYVKLDQPIPASQTFFNILAPGVVEDHLTLGLTVATSKTGELTVMYMHAFEKEVNGSNSIPMAFGGGNANLRMSQDSLGVAYGWKY